MKPPPDHVFTAVLVDDHPDANINLEHQLVKTGIVKVVGMATDAFNGLGLVSQHKPQLLFLDIDMPGQNGFDLVKQLRLQDSMPTIIFVTAYNNYAIEAIRHAAFDFLVKPVEAGDLKAALDRLQAEKPVGIEQKIDLLLSEMEGNHKIKLESSGSFIMVDPSEIIYCQADWNYSEVYLTGDRREVLSMSIGKLEASLISRRFFRINRSIIINIDYLAKVKRILRKCILKQNGQEYSFSIPRANIRELEKRMEG